MPPFKDLTGKRFGRLLVLKRVANFVYPKKGVQVGYLCRCDCGQVGKFNAGRLREGTTKSCGCLRRDLLAEKNGVGPYRALYNKLVASNERVKRASSISYAEFLQFTKTTVCHYCDAGITWSEIKRDGFPFGYNLDRKDSLQGYSKDNCVVCCPRCNRSKSNTFGYEEWLEVGKAIKQFRERENVKS